MTWQRIQKGRCFEQRQELLGNVGSKRRDIGNFLDDGRASIDDGQKILQVVTAGIVTPAASGECFELGGNEVRSSYYTDAQFWLSAISCAASMAARYQRLVKPRIFSSRG